MSALYAWLGIVSAYALRTNGKDVRCVDIAARRRGGQQDGMRAVVARRVVSRSRLRRLQTRHARVELPQTVHVQLGAKIHGDCRTATPVTRRRCYRPRPRPRPRPRLPPVCEGCS